jgi:uncharacterized protein YbbK (DUF523 family)
MIAVSYCKLGLKCTYKCGANEELPDSEFLKKLFRKGFLIPLCPEVFGGLTTPRDASEIVGGNGFDVIDGRAKVLSLKGEDVTKKFLDGAAMCVDIALKYGAMAAVLNEYSPSCGVNFVYDGSFSKKPVPGPGVLGAMLLKNMPRAFKLFGQPAENEQNFLLNLFDNVKNL